MQRSQIESENTNTKPCGDCGAPLPAQHDPRRPCCAACIREQTRAFLAARPWLVSHV
jgi:hypothetical protein